MIHRIFATGLFNTGSRLTTLSPFLLFKHLFNLVPLLAPFLLHSSQRGIGLLRRGKGPVMVLLIPEYPPALLVASSNKGVILSNEERARERMGANAPALEPPARLQLGDHCSIHRFLLS